MGKFPVLIISALCIVSFLVGRISVPSKVETQEKYIDRIVTKVDETKVQQLTQQVALLQTQLLTVNRTSIKTTHTVKKPDGTVETITQVNANSETQRQEINRVVVNNNNSTTESKHSTNDILHQKELSKTQTQIESQWYVAAIVGIQLDNLNIKTNPPYVDPFYYGIMVNRKIVGPLYVGGWILNNKSGGLTLGVEF